MELHRKDLIGKKKIAIIEPNAKEKNDRTFCFWLSPSELNEFEIAHLVSHEWENVVCNDLPAQAMETYRYYYIRAESLYTHAKSILEHYDCLWQRKEFDEMSDQCSGLTFDSRPPQKVVLPRHERFLIQSFYGWVIRTKEAVFDATTFTMMDFNVDQGGASQFLYVLPFDEYTALIEPTRFGTHPLKEAEAEEIIQHYLTQKNLSFEIIEKESGSIPMCSLQPDLSLSHSTHLAMGSRAGQLKPSTGYSFIRNLADARIIAEHIDGTSNLVARRVSLKRFQYYDRLLLRILHDSPKFGKVIFTQLFEKNKAENVLRFLDEKTTIREEVKLMRSLPIGVFLTAAMKDVFSRGSILFRQKTPIIWVGLLALGLQYLGVINFLTPLLVIGLLGIGIPHGALDHLHQIKKFTLLQVLRFIFQYVAIGSLMYGLWFVSPSLGLLLFILYSSWHFGQADFEDYLGKPNRFLCFTWGLLYLLITFFTHPSETRSILQSMNVDLLFIPQYMSYFIGYVLIGFLCIIQLSIRKHHVLLSSIVLLILSIKLPLLIAFSIYFIFQHSIQGWNKLRSVTKRSSLSLWYNALPFTLGSLLLFFIGYVWIENISWGYVFIFLSALSLPHVYLMNKTYA